MNTTKKPGWRLTIAALAIVACGTMLRLAYNSETFFIEPVRGDAAYYFIYAHNLVEHPTFSKERGDNPTPDAFWTPGYPAFLAVNFIASDYLDTKAYDLALRSQVALAAASIWLLYLLGRLFMPAYWPLLPAALLAFSPHHVSLGSYVLTETLFGFLLLAGIYSLAKALLYGNLITFLSCGLVLAAAYMVNPVCLIVIPAIGLALWLIDRRSPAKTSLGLKVKRASLLLLPLLIVASLWSLRSVPEGQMTGADRLLANLTVGLYPDYHEKWMTSILDPEAGIVVPGEGVDESYSRFLQEAVARFSAAPSAMIAWYAFGKPYQLWQWDILTGQGDIYVYEVLYSLYNLSPPALASYTLMRALHPWLLITSMLGLLLMLAGRPRASDITVPALAYATMLSVSAVYVLTQAEPRYSVPLRPELYLTAVFFIWQACQYLGALRRQSLQRHQAAKSAAAAE